MGQRVEKTATRVAGATFESVRVRRWRRDQFYDLGFPLADARALAAAPVDLGDTRRLIAAGCPVRTALRILL
jgi:hypothetical protein